MGFFDSLGNLVGIGGQNQGAGFVPKSTDIRQGVSPEELAASQGRSLQGLQGQQAFLQALQAQNGIGNQSSVFSQQQALANQLGQQAQGQGPNPALAQLQQQTGVNAANQAALMASSRGAGANPGLIARQAAMQGSGVQQQAVGQAATLQAQQQLAAQDALQRQQSLMGGMANTMVGNQAQATTGYSQAAQAQQQAYLNSLAQQNAAGVSMQSNINNVQGTLAGQAAGHEAGLIGGIAGGLGVAAPWAASALKGSPSQPTDPTASSSLGASDLPTQTAGGIQTAARGGMIRRMAQGGSVDGPQSEAGQFLQSWQPQASPNLNYGETYRNIAPPSQGGGQDIMGTAMKYAPLIAAASKGGMMGKNLKGGGGVPGKAKVKGDSYSNDTVPAVLSPGEIVIPRSITGSQGAPDKAKAFVEAILAKHRAMGARK